LPLFFGNYENHSDFVTTDLYNKSYVYSKFVVPEPPLPVLTIIMPTTELLPKSSRINYNCPNIEDYCIHYVKSKGVNIESPVVYAKNIVPNTDGACVGCGVLLSAGRFGHIGFVEEIIDDYLLISESNYIDCGQISTRSIWLNDPFIRGYVK